MPDRTPALIVLRPGDKVLVQVADDPDDTERETIVRGLRVAFRGVDFTLLTGVFGIAISPPD